MDILLISKLDNPPVLEILNVENTVHLLQTWC